MTARSKALACGLSFVGIAGSKLAREMDIVSYEYYVLSDIETLRLADPSSRGVLMSVSVSLSAVKLQQQLSSPTASR